MDRQHHRSTMDWLNRKEAVFVANRMAEILDLTATDEWNYVQSSNNLANAGTICLSANALAESKWKFGLDFLRTPQWPFEPSENF